MIIAVYFLFVDTFIYIFSRMTTCGQEDLEMTIVFLKFFKSHFKSNLFSHFHYHHEIGGGQKELFKPTPPPQDILEGNGLVFGNFTFNNVRRNLTVHHSVTPFVIRQPIRRPHLLERVYKPMHTSH